MSDYALQPFDSAFSDAEQPEHASVNELLRPLRALLDWPDVTELCVNEPGRAFIESDGGWTEQAVPEMTFIRCLAAARAIATYTNQDVGESRPLLSATLPTGERIQIVYPPATSRQCVSLTIRKPGTRVRTLGELAVQGIFERIGPSTSSGPTDTEWRLDGLKNERRFGEFLKLAVASRQTIVVSGATGSGKTTFMKGLIQEIDRAERLITIEDASEITLPDHPNKVHLFYSKGGQGVARVSPTDLLEACLRMKPDRIFLAEVRGRECFDFVNLAAAGHPGSITSVHAQSCALALERMALMIRQSDAGSGLTHAEICRLLRLVVDVVVQFDRDERGRFVREIDYDPARRYRSE
jgi:type IV secretion system protein VirB11